MINLKNSISTVVFIFLLGLGKLMACDACKLQQPKITREFTHGAGPQSNWDWVLVGSIAALTIYTFIFSVKYLVSPQEKNTDHIKNRMLDEKWN